MASLSANGRYSNHYMPNTYDSELAKKLNVRSGTKIHVAKKPADVDLPGISGVSAAKADGVLIFVRTIADVEATAALVVNAAREDRLAWLAYPKAGKLGTDLNRDILWKHMLGKGIQGVRQIAIDETWSAMRFRPES
jgi:hypothetical protein